MIVTEYYMTRKDGVKLYRTYSDAGFLLRQMETGTLYGEAIDVESAGYTYEEIEMVTEDVLEGQKMPVELSAGKGY